MYYTCENFKRSYKNNKCKISVPTWNEKFELPDRSYSVSYMYKKKNGENVSYLEITEVELVNCSVVNNDYQQDFIKNLIKSVGCICFSKVIW